MGVTVSYEFGGVDVYSNSLNRPANRALVCRNFIPVSSGELRLRDGYSRVTMTSPPAGVIHSLTDFKVSSTRYIIYIYGTTVKQLALADGTITAVGSLSSSSPCEFAKADGKLFIVNGTDQKVYDGTTLRDIGIRAGTDAEVASVTVTEVLRQPSTTETSTTTATAAGSGGSLAATTKAGVQFYLHYLGTTEGYSFGPGLAIQGRKTLVASDKVDFANLPDISALFGGNGVKIFSRTGDATSISKFCASATFTISNLSVGVGDPRIITITATGHGLATGDVVEIGATGFEGVYAVTVTDANTFTYKDTVHRANSGTTGAISATGYKLVKTAKATTTQAITLATTGAMQANGDVGVAYSAFTDAEAGYFAYVSLYNPTTQAIGNRVRIQGRFKPGTASTRAIFIVEGLPSPSGIDAEFYWLQGRTGDEADVPWVITDSAGNYQYTDASYMVLREGYVVGNIELPIANDKPSGFIDIEKCGDRLYAIKGDRYVYHTPVPDPNFPGVEEQSWFGDDFESFPRGEDTVAIAEYQQDCVVFTERSCAVLQDLAGSFAWDGPWDVGIAGKRAYTNSHYGPYWLTSDKQLYTISANGPVCVSTEYEKSLLANISSTYLSSAEVVYLKDPDRDIDRIEIKGKDSTGTPFIVCHDFRLRDGQSVTGQGYDLVYQGELNTDFTVAQVRDANGKMRLFAGGADGRIYQLDSTGADVDSSNTATTFIGTYLALVNWGEGKKAIPGFLFCGDSRLVVSHASNLDATALKTLAKQLVPDMQHDSTFRVGRSAMASKSPEYLQFQLTSHATATEPMALNTTPHFPVEMYGRVYAIGVEIE